MRADALVANQLYMAQSIDALADHFASSTGYRFTPVTFANLPATPALGMVACVTDSTVVSNPGAFGTNVTVGGGTNKQLVWYNGTNWTIVGI